MNEEIGREGDRPWEALPREGPYPPTLEERTVSRLRAEGRFGPRPLRFVRWAAAAVLAALLVAGGWLAGRGRPVRAGAPRFALLLYEGRGFEGSVTADRVAEYRSWAAALRRSGVQVAGEKLSPAFRRVPATAAAGDREVLAGFFVVGAPDLDAAEAIARSCPHLRHGGTIVVRPIAAT